MSLNKAIVQGWVGREPEVKVGATGKHYAHFSIGVQRDFKDKSTGKSETDWLNVMAFGNLADFVSTYFKKGSQVIVDGKLTVSKWEDKDGNKREMVQIFADRTYFCGNKKESRNDQAIMRQGKAEIEEMEEYDDDLPW